MNSLPKELCLNILEYLGKTGNTRDMVNLTRVLGYNEEICYKYLLFELEKSRNCYTLNYDNNMIDLWERCGIDDGLSPEYISEKLNKHTRMYRTIWASDIITDRNNGFLSYSYSAEEFRMKYTNCIFKDFRNLLESKARDKQILYLQKVFNNTKKVKINLSKSKINTRAKYYDAVIYVEQVI